MMNWQGFDPMGVAQWETELVSALPSNLGSSCVVEWGELPEVSDNPEPDDAPLVRPILAHTTIGTLRRGVFKTSDPERFWLDVVICREGDHDRRQLKSIVGLASYCREE
jgi:hypothetical protein